MSKRDVRLFLTEMIEAIDRIETYTTDMSFGEFKYNLMVRDAVVRNLDIIGEAARHVHDDLRSRHPEIPWRQLVGFRNIVIHEYFDVDLSVVWEIVDDLKRLRADLQQVLDNLTPAH